MNWIFVFPPNSHLEALTSNVMIFGDVTLGRKLWLNEVMGAGPWSDQIRALIKRNSRELFLSLSLPYEDTEKEAVSKPIEGPPQELNHDGTLILDFQPPELWKINVCCLNHAACILLQQPEQTNTTAKDCSFQRGFVFTSTKFLDSFFFNFLSYFLVLVCFMWKL